MALIAPSLIKPIGPIRAWQMNYRGEPAFPPVAPPGRPLRQRTTTVPVLGSAFTDLLRLSNWVTSDITVAE